jgi:hypothetical protein
MYFGIVRTKSKTSNGSEKGGRRGRGRPRRTWEDCVMKGKTFADMKRLA